MGITQRRPIGLVDGRMKISFLRAAMLLLLFSLTACVSAPPRIEGSSQGIELSKLQSWHANGRIGVSAAQTGGSGSFNWAQQGMQSVVQLSGPVGIGSVQLRLNGDAVEVATGDGQTYQAQAALDELEARLGAVIPPAKLRYWLMGLAAPGEYRWLDENKSLLEQDGWHIEYGEFLNQDGVRLPSKITASSGTTRVRILVERWQLG
jgi:outer membrane lipoprotein LolB